MIVHQYILPISLIFATGPILTLCGPSSFFLGGGGPVPSLNPRKKLEVFVFHTLEREDFDANPILKNKAYFLCFTEESFVLGQLIWKLMLDSQCNL